MENLQTMLREHNLKSTTQRLLILDALYRHGHANVDEIHDELKKVNPLMSITTIYRNINEMITHKLLSEVKIPKQKQKYEITKESHIHLSCKNCGSVKDAFVHTEGFVKEVEQNYQCDVLDDAIVLEVVCSECKN